MRTISLPAPIATTGAERATLVRRTYALVFANVVVTMCGAAFGLTQPALMATVARHPIITFFVSLVPLMLAMRTRQSPPRSIGLVFLFALVMGVSISPLLYMYGRTQPGLISQAAVLTLSTFGVLTLYAWFSRRDFSAWGSFFVVGLWVVLATSLLNLFFQNETARLWLAGATLLVFSGLLVFDTWRLKHVYGPNDYVMAAVQIYLDLLNMFMAILSLLGGRRD